MLLRFVSFDFDELNDAGVHCSTMQCDGVPIGSLMVFSRRYGESNIVPSSEHTGDEKSSFFTTNPIKF